MNDPKKYSSELTPQDLLTEIKVNLSTGNPDIDISKSVIIKNGPRAYKIALLYAIKSRNSGEVKHEALRLQTFQRLKRGWEESPSNSITLENKEGDEIQKLYDFLFSHASDIIPRDNGNYLLVKEGEYLELVKKSNVQTHLVQSVLEDPDEYQELIKLGGLDLLSDIIKISLSDESANDLSLKLKELDVNQISKLNSISGLTQLKAYCEIWDREKSNADEEFWQRTLSEYSWVISQIYSFPVVIFQEKAYVGGKWLNNKGGNVADFIYKNELTTNVFIVDIKTPAAKIVGPRYRQTYAPSTEVSGGVIQLLNYKNKLLRDYSNLISNHPDEQRFDTFNPRCLLIIGNYEEEIADSSKKEAFELSRSNSKDIDIITFDELYTKVNIMVKLLEGKL